MSFIKKRRINLERNNKNRLKIFHIGTRKIRKIKKKSKVKTLHAV